MVPRAELDDACIVEQGRETARYTSFMAGLIHYHKVALQQQ
jgi:hypothetical protein